MGIFISKQTAQYSFDALLLFVCLGQIMPYRCLSSCIWLRAGGIYRCYMYMHPSLLPPPCCPSVCGYFTRDHALHCTTQGPSNKHHQI
ncbi:hypothetical protein J3E68DRAFT_416303 [Trichoderma sp. SZMC 28012]